MAKRIFILFSFFYLRSEENYYYYYYVKGKEELSERLGIHSQKQLDKQSIDKTARHLRSIVRSDVPHRVDGVEKVERDKYGKWKLNKNKKRGSNGTSIAVSSFSSSVRLEEEENDDDEPVVIGTDGWTDGRMDGRTDLLAGPFLLPSTRPSIKYEPRL